MITFLFVILVIPHKISKAPNTLKGIRWRMSELFHTNTLIREMRAVEFVTDLIDHQGVGQANLKRVNMHIIEDNDFFSELNPSSRLNTDKDFIRMLYDRGRSVAASWVKKNYESVGKKSSIDIKDVFVS
jgi:NTE family protein